MNKQRAAILVANHVEQIEMLSPQKTLKEAGIEVTLMAPQKQIQGWNHHEKADVFSIDKFILEASPANYDVAILPGGVINGDLLRQNAEAKIFIKHFAVAKKPIAAICHGGWILIECGIVRGRIVTSWPSLSTDFRNAGAEWIDQEVIVDGNLITSRKPADLSIFNAEILKLLYKSKKIQRMSQNSTHIQIHR